MIYYTFKVSLKDYEDRLNRTIFIRGINDLDSLAVAILSSFNTLAYHLYKFEDKANTYECLASYEEGVYFDPDIKCSNEHKINELEFDENNTITFVYDFGDYYEFTIELLMKEDLQLKLKVPVILDGVGYGIVEDGKCELTDYLDGVTDGSNLVFCTNNRYVKEDFNNFDLESQNRKLKHNYSTIHLNYSFTD